MQIILEYISDSYMTLVLLAGLVVILIANRRTKIEGLEYIWAITALVFVLTICEYAESWCDTYHKPVWILYLKAAVTYIIPPLLILLELYLVTPIRHKLLMFLPFVTDVVLIVLDLFGKNLIYGYHPDHSFQPGPLHFFPAMILCYYIFLLLISSLEFLQKKAYSKAMVVIFMAVSTIITVWLEYEGIIVKHTTEIAALEILIYYFYLAAIQHSKMQETLHESQLEVEHQKIELLKAQIQPHFIYNSLMALQSKSIDNPVLYRGIENFGKYLRANFEALTDKHLILFKDELKSIRAYAELERLNYGEKLNIEYHIVYDDFMLPALTVEPLVENAIRYGVGTYEKGGTVRIIVRDEPDHIHIEVKDDGSGGNKLTDAQKKRKGIGIENVRMRLTAMKMGDLHISQDETGTSAVIRLYKKENEHENDHS